ncbi:S1C family serine protease [Bacillus testis]|uniref:S1C family serine protease n=1 Tax=Bacillus testis TaxID=1622072 RepID=UPI000B1FE8A9|nr:trypsin-like peptidase domain-containing protein [Bacillus testis]
MNHSNDNDPRKMNVNDDNINNETNDDVNESGRFDEREAVEQSSTYREADNSYTSARSMQDEENQEEPFIPISDEQYEKQRKRKMKPKTKGFLSTVAAGVIGSVITLSVIPFTDYPDMFQGDHSSSQSASQDAQVETKPMKVTQTSTAKASIADMVEKASPAIVGVVNMQRQQQSFGSFFRGSEQQSNADGEEIESGSGSGVIFKKEGNYAYIVTNNHVIEGASKIEVALADGKQTTAELIGADALSDLAVLKIPSKYVTSVLEFADSSALRAGDEVIAIGNPLGLDLSRTVTQGIVSAVNRSVAVNTSAGEWNLNVIQTDAAINPGNSGGALLNPSGQVVGINSLKISENGVEGLGFAIPSNELVPIVNEIIETGQVQRVYLGVGLASIDEIPEMYLQDLPKSVDGGVIVTNIDKDSAAYRAGLKVQDVIVAINDMKVKSPTELRQYLYSKLKVGDRATIKFYRDGQLKTATVTLTSTASKSAN